MSHRVIQFTSTVTSQSQADNMQKDIQSELDARGLDLHTREVNDGQTLEGVDTLAVKTDHNKDSEANSFFEWLWNYAENSKAEFDTNGDVVTEGFTMARIQVHDCMHLEGLSEPCEIGNAEKYDIRPQK